MTQANYDLSRDLAGRTVVDSTGAEIGTVRQIFFNDQSTQPEWVTVSGGSSGTSTDEESFVPLRGADLSGTRIVVQATKDSVAGAPRPANNGHLAVAQEQELYRYYAAQLGTGFGTDPTAGRGDRQAAAPTSPEPSGAVDMAKDQAAAVGKTATDAGQHVATVAQDQAKNVVSEAGAQAKELLAQTKSELSEQAGAQQQRLAGGLHALGDELHAMTQHSEPVGVATDLARQGASRSHDIASWLEDREPGDLVRELQSFARQRPGAFLLAAAGAGLLAGRLTRGVQDGGAGETSAEGTTQ